MSSVSIAWGNRPRNCCSRHISPSTTSCIVLCVSGGKPRRVACSRAHCSAFSRELKVANIFLLIGPCSLPSSPHFSVYIATSVALRPFLLLSPRLRFFLGPWALRLARPRCRLQLQPSVLHLRRLQLQPSVLHLRGPRRLSSSSSVAVGMALQSHSMTRISPSPCGSGPELSQP